MIIFFQLTLSLPLRLLTPHSGETNAPLKLLLYLSPLSQPTQAKRTDHSERATSFLKKATS